MIKILNLFMHREDIEQLGHLILKNRIQQKLILFITKEIKIIIIN